LQAAVAGLQTERAEAVIAATSQLISAVAADTGVEAGGVSKL
jgi:hypothetical protein